MSALTGGALAEGLHEGPVDLEAVERVATEVAERRVAGAEVVHGQGDADGVDVAEALHGELGLVDQQALGDLDAEAVGGEVVVP